MSAAHNSMSPPSIEAPEDVHPQGKPEEKKTCWRKFVDWFKDEDKGKWLEGMRGMLSVASTMISTITFQSSINPPGGVLPASDNATLADLQECLNEVNRSCAGEAVLPIIYADLYYKFQLCNSIAFVASLSVTLLLVSGLPLKHRFPMWILLITMILTLSSLAFTYLFAMVLVTPSVPGAWGRTVMIVERAIYTWAALVGIIALALTVQFFVWLVNKCIMRFMHRKPTVPRNQREHFNQSHM